MVTSLVNGCVWVFGYICLCVCLPVYNNVLSMFIFVCVSIYLVFIYLYVSFCLLVSEEKDMSILKTKKKFFISLLNIFKLFVNLFSGN